jgi:hypothetical protein
MSAGRLALKDTPNTTVSMFGCEKGIISDWIAGQGSAVNTLFLVGQSSDAGVRYAADGSALSGYDVEGENRNVYLGSGDAMEWGFRESGSLAAGEEGLYGVRWLRDRVQLLDGEIRGLLMIVGL